MTMLAEKIAGRQHQVRLWLLSEMEHLPLAATMGDLGTYAVNRWYRFGQLALYQSGASLAPDSQWGSIRDEMAEWPMFKWLSILENDTIIGEAKEVYTSATDGRLTITQHTAQGATRPFQLNRLSWARGMQTASYLQIWKWLGPVGGELPVRPTD